MTAASTGNAAVSGFDPAHDAVQVSHTIPGFLTPFVALATVQSDPHNAGDPGNTYIALDAHDSITLVGVHPSQLTSANILPY